MGFARRVVRKTVRKATPRPVRQAMHPARTVKNAATPRPVRKVSRAVYTVRNPLGAAENKVIGAALNAGHGRRRARRSGRTTGLGLFWISFGRRRGRRRQPDPPAAGTERRPGAPQNAAPAVHPVPAEPQRAPAPVSLAAQISGWNNGPGGTAQRAVSADLHAVAAAARVAAADPASASARLKHRQALTLLASDVAAALRAPPVPDAEAQYWWAKALAELQKAAADGQVGVDTRNQRMHHQAALGLRAAAESVTEITKRFNALRDAAQAPRQP